MLDGEHPAPCYSIPFPPNKDVIHRTAISDRLAALLPPSREYHSAALWGLGGCGYDGTRQMNSVRGDRC